MPSILFVCTANQFRSPLAAACLLKEISLQNTEGKWNVKSAGTWAGVGVSAPGFTLQVAGQLGLSGLAGHRTRPIDKKLLDEYDLIIAMEAGHKEAICAEFPPACSRTYLLSEIVDGISYDIPDPASSDIDPKDIGRELNMLIVKGKEKILQLAEAGGNNQSYVREES